jgi:hypothetical protein
MKTHVASKSSAESAPRCAPGCCDAESNVVKADAVNEAIRERLRQRYGAAVQALTKGTDASRWFEFVRYRHRGHRPDHSWPLRHRPGGGRA